MPADSAAASLEAPLAIAIQNGRRATRGNTGGRPGDRNVPCPIRSTERFRFAVIASPVAGVLQRPIEFTPCPSAAFTARLTAHGIRISMDGQGCWRDNVFVADARAGLGRYLTLYNMRRLHSSLADQSPAVAFSSHPSLPLPVAA